MLIDHARFTLLLNVAVGIAVDPEPLGELNDGNLLVLSSGFDVYLDLCIVDHGEFSQRLFAKIDRTDEINCPIFMSTAYNL
jgi:hypothetical protein